MALSPSLETLWPCRLIGVLAVESTNPMAFMVREETLLTIVAAQLTVGIDQLGRDTEEAPPDSTQRNARPHLCRFSPRGPGGSASFMSTIAPSWTASI